MRAAGTVSVLTALAVWCGLPYWRTHAWAAAATVCCCAGLGAAGVLMRTERRTRLCGVMLLAAGTAWSLTWSQSWDSGPLPVIGQFAQSVTFLALGIAILQYLNPGRLERAERWWIMAGALVLLGGTALSIAMSRPGWMGYHADVFWPHVRTGHDRFALFVALLSESFIVLAVGYGCVLVRQAKERLARKYRRLTAPLLVLILASALASAWAEQGGTLTSLGRSLDTFAVQSLIGVFFLAALLYTGLVDRFSGLRVKDRIISRASPPTMSGFRDAVAEALDDPGLQVYYRIPDSDQYADSRGRPAGRFRKASREESSDGNRYRCEVFADSGALAAVIDLDRKLRERPGLIDAAKSVARLLLMHSGLRDEVRSTGLRLQRQSQVDILQADITDRQRLERDLHDGAQQMLIALSMKMGAAAVSLDDPGLRGLVAGWRRDLRDATDELRNLARGIYPATLSEQGVKAALDSLAERQTELRVDLDIPEARFPVIIETSLYFAVAEAVANAAKHARASRVRIRVAHETPWLACIVADDGNGEAVQRPGGGLEGIVNRVRVLGGDVRISATPGEGSAVVMRLPCE